jgi:hypothetical protein
MPVFGKSARTLRFILRCNHGRILKTYRQPPIRETIVVISAVKEAPMNKILVLVRAATRVSA